MKQTILNLKKKLLLVEIGGKLSDEFVQVIDEYGMAEILGKLTDMTESQFAGITGVENISQEFDDEVGLVVPESAILSFFNA